MNKQSTVYGLAYKATGEILKLNTSFDSEGYGEESYSLHLDSTSNQIWSVGTSKKAKLAMLGGQSDNSGVLMSLPKHNFKAEDLEIVEIKLNTTVLDSEEIKLPTVREVYTEFLNSSDTGLVSTAKFILRAATREELDEVCFSEFYVTQYEKMVNSK